MDKTKKETRGRKEKHQGGAVTAQFKCSAEQKEAWQHAAEQRGMNFTDAAIMALNTFFNLKP